MITRIVKLPKHNNVLVGRDLAELFDSGYVYEIKKFSEEFVITKLGKSALPTDNNYPNVNSTIEDIMMHRQYICTEEEDERIRSSAKILLYKNS